MAEVKNKLTSQAAEQLAKKLMRQHGVAAQGWKFQWSSGKRRLGEASIRRRKHRTTGRVETRKTIKLSRHLVALNPEPVVRDVILHEIAHALAGLENGHNEVWQAACKKVGAKPQRLADEGVDVVAGKYTVVCKLCKQTLGTRHRRSSPDALARTYCRDCGPNSAGKVQLIRND
jgi:predicted SprT family Zn-dependent metalloprotease